MLIMHFTPFFVVVREEKMCNICVYSFERRILKGVQIQIKLCAKS